MPAERSSPLTARGLLELVALLFPLPLPGLEEAAQRGQPAGVLAHFHHRPAGAHAGVRRPRVGAQGARPHVTVPALWTCECTHLS